MFEVRFISQIAQFVLRISQTVYEHVDLSIFRFFADRAVCFKDSSDCLRTRRLIYFPLFPSMPQEMKPKCSFLKRQSHHNNRCKL